MLHQPHHDGSPLHVSDPDPDLGDRVTVWVRAPAAAEVSEVHLRALADAEPFWSAAVPDRRTAHETWWRADLTVHDPRQRYRFLLGTPHGPRWLTAAGTSEADPLDVTDFQLSAHPPPPAWAGDAVWYQILPDRFARGSTEIAWPSWAEPAAWDDPVAERGPAAMRQLYGGDLWGIRERLDHLVDLGVDAVYLNPFFPAPSNHRYNAADFDRVDPVLGGEEALAALTEALHARGLRVLGDLTANHTGSTHHWFAAAQRDPDAPEASFYAFDAWPDQYRTWRGVATLPKLDHRDPGLRARLLEGPDSVAGRWLAPPFNLDGWRVDAANMAGRDGAVDQNRRVAETLRMTLDVVRPEGLLLAEHCHDATADLDGGGWHGTMDYASFTRPLWSWLIAPERQVGYLEEPLGVPRRPGTAIAQTLRTFRGAMPWRAGRHSLTLLDSHDTGRFRTAAGTRAGHLVGVAAQMTLPGMPSAFAGDELGLEGWDNHASRAPIPWDRQRWDHATLAAYRALIALRRAHPALRTGGLRWAAVGTDHLTFLRELPHERLLIHLARAPHAPVHLDTDALGATRAEGLAATTEEGMAPAPDLAASGTALVLPDQGPASGVWRLV